MENNKRKYGLVWDKETHLEDCVLKHNTHTPYLVEDKTKEIIGEEGKPSHVLIEGDNFHSLTIMQQTHKNAIDIICIDPPYNTGHEFTYNDRRVDEEDNYKHSKWLNFMEKRIKLSYNLLKEDGICYTFIGEDELANLILMMNQIFGTKNKLSIISRKTSGGAGEAAHINDSCDYILVYVKNINLLNKEAFTTAIDKSKYTEKDSNGSYKWNGALCSASMTSSRPNQRYWVECPDGSFIIPIGDTLPEKIKNGEHIKSKDGDFRWTASYKTFLEEKELFRVVPGNSKNLMNEHGKPSKWKLEKKVYSNIADIKRNPISNFLTDPKFYNAAGTKELKELFGGRKVFDYPKPVALIQHLIKITNKSSNITILDFFAGSGTTGQAVIDLNAHDNGTRKSIMCAMNDIEDDIDICTDVTYKRIKMVTENWIKQSKTELGGWDGFPPTLKFYNTKFINNTDPLTILRVEENNKKII